MPSPSLPPKLAMGRMPVLSVKAKHLFALPRRKDGCRAYPCPYIAVDRILTEKSCEDSVCMSFPAALRYRLPEFRMIRITSEFQIMNGRRVITEGAIVRLLNRLEDPLHAVLQQTIPATSCFASTRRMTEPFGESDMAVQGARFTDGRCVPAAYQALCDPSRAASTP